MNGRSEVEADAFLYRMVRRMVYLQVTAAQGKFPRARWPVCWLGIRFPFPPGWPRRMG